MGNKHKNEDSYVLNFVSKKLDRMTADIPAVRVESRQKTGHKRLKLSLSLIPACLLILVIFANIVLLERRAQQQQTFNSISGKCSLDNLVLGISISAVNRKFLSLGGTKHWFHLTERLILNIDRIIKFRKKVASLKGRDDKVIYIIFDQKYDVENLGPFGRLLFVSLVSGGRTPNKEPIFERIIFGYSSLKKVMHSAETVAKNMSAEAHEFHPHHIVDLRSQGGEQQTETPLLKLISHLVFQLRFELLTYLVST